MGEASGSGWMDSRDCWAEQGQEAAGVKVSRGRVLKGLESQMRELGSFPRPAGSHGRVLSGGRTGSGLSGPAGEWGQIEGSNNGAGNLGRGWGGPSRERRALDLSQ